MPTSILPGATLVARIPVLDLKGALFGYRVDPVTGERDERQSVTAGAASAVQAVRAHGFDALSGGKLLFLPVAAEQLAGLADEPFPADRTVLELAAEAWAEQITPVDIAPLIASGYRFSVTDPVVAGEGSRWSKGLSFASFDSMDPDALAEMQIAKDTSPRVRCIARGVNELWQVVESRNSRADLVQGYHFLKPPARRACVSLPVVRCNQLQLIAELACTDAELADVAAIVRRDPSLSLQLVKRVNSAGFAIRHEVQSLDHAVRLIGLTPLRRWALREVFAQACVHKPTELVRTCFVRAAFCEAVAARWPGECRPFDGFLAGLLSAVESAFDCTVEQVLDHIELPDAVGLAIGRYAGLVGLMLLLALAIEADDWTDITEYTEALGLGIDDVAAAQAAALQVAREMDG